MIMLPTANVHGFGWSSSIGVVVVVTLGARRVVVRPFAFVVV
jgi:hypothetical protein